MIFAIASIMTYCMTRSASWSTVWGIVSPTWRRCMKAFNGQSISLCGERRRSPAPGRATEGSDARRQVKRLVMPDAAIGARGIIDGNS